MKNLSPESKVNIEHHMIFRTCNNIFDKWGISSNQKNSILGMTEADFTAYQSDSESSPLTNEQIERLSYILNIHFELKMIFSNPENIYGCMNMNNNNPNFKGKTPISLIETGDLIALQNVFLEVKSISGH